MGALSSSDILNAQSSRAVVIKSERSATCLPGQTLNEHEKHHYLAKPPLPSSKAEIEQRCIRLERPIVVEPACRVEHLRVRKDRGVTAYRPMVSNNHGVFWYAVVSLRSELISVQSSREYWVAYPNDILRCLMSKSFERSYEHIYSEGENINLPLPPTGLHR